MGGGHFAFRLRLGRDRAACPHSNRQVARRRLSLSASCLRLFERRTMLEPLLLFHASPAIGVGNRPSRRASRRAGCRLGGCRRPCGLPGPRAPLLLRQARPRPSPRRSRAPSSGHPVRDRSVCHAVPRHDDSMECLWVRIARCSAGRLAIPMGCCRVVARRRLVIPLRRPRAADTPASRLSSLPRLRWTLDCRIILAASIRMASFSVPLRSSIRWIAAHRARIADAGEAPRSRLSNFWWSSRSSAC